MEDRQFYQSISDVLPDDQQVQTVSPDTPVADAVEIMREENYSQLPVVDDERVMGIFSYRSFTEGILDLLEQNPSEDELTVGALMNQPPFRSVERDPEEVFEDLDRHDAVLVESRTNLTGILTAMDVLHHLHSVAQPFVLIAEIERHAREVIDSCVDEDELEECAVRALHESPYQDEEDVPVELTEMSMGDLVGIVRHGDNWNTHFGDAFSASGNDLQRGIVETRLDDIRELRNTVFHLKRSLDEDEIDTLRETRTWIRERRESVQANANVQTQEDEG
ncbi:hypothetical protein BSZ35_02460 [Salinibacter sp. 10B]|uniref:CBS domain-containing protein n=1 Tax=Salinibacter sp. 10B TaxID=1923971 RepID=UPI000CF387B2|nr:CBS domain-containing protein [Salinibacter sp. 10B]PQJ33612.1 hypothetical protein BSZ35_02460 [Salinibacter sp. 10B]